MAKIYSFFGGKKRFIWIAVIVVIAGGNYYYYKKKQSSADQVQYITSPAEKGTLTSAISASGNVIVDDSANVDPTITGTVANLAVAVGDEVTEGHLLFNIVNNDLSVAVSKSSASLAQAESSLASAKASKKQASADYEKAKKDGTGKSAEDEEALKKKEEAAGEAVTAAEQSLASAQADYNNTLQDAAKRKVTSPIDGTVNAVNVKNGDDLSKLSSGSSRLVPIIIGDLSTIKAQVQVNEVDIANVSTGQKVVLAMDALEGVEMTGKVEKIDSLGTSDQGVVTYNVTITFDSLDSRIKPEMSVTASIITDVKQSVLIVPASAVKAQSNSTYVEVLNDGGTPVQKNVEIGITNGTDTEILSGLDEGDKVVTQTINPNASTSSSSSGNSLRVPGLGGGR